jgi:hypothetical protein
MREDGRKFQNYCVPAKRLHPQKGEPYAKNQTTHNTFICSWHTALLFWMYPLGRYAPALKFSDIFPHPVVPCLRRFLRLMPFLYHTTACVVKSIGSKNHVCRKWLDNASRDLYKKLENFCVRGTLKTRGTDQ